MADVTNEDHAPGAPPLGDARDDQAYARRLPRRQFVNDMPDRGLFGFVAVFGFVIIVALKLYEYDSKLVAATAVALMLGYGLIAYRMPQVQLRVDRLGDNFYYLGFIYTLASMSAALLQLQGDVTNLNAVLGSFGIALFTTIVGIAGRVMFVQLRSEIDEVEVEVRREFVETSDALRAQLNQSLREFETFTISVKQAAEEHRAHSSEAARKQMELIAVLAQAAASEIQSAFAENRAAAKDMGQTVQDAGTAVQLMVHRVSSLELPNTRLDEQMTVFGQGLEALLTRLAQAIDEVGRASSSRSLRGDRRRSWWWPFRR